MTTVTHTSTELKFHVTVIIIGLNPHTISNSTQIKHRTFTSLFVVTSLQSASTDEFPFDHQFGSVFLQSYLWSEKQKHFVKLMTLFSSKNKTFFSVIFSFPSSQIADAITSENLFKPYDPRITQPLAIQYDCYQQYKLGQFSLTRVQKCTQARSGIECTATFVSVRIRAKAIENKAFSWFETIQENRDFCAQGAHYIYHKHDRMGWHTISMPLPKELHPNEGRRNIRKFNRTDSAELNQNFCRGPFTYFDRLSFQVESEQVQTKPTSFTVTKLNAVRTGVFTYQPKFFDWITSTANRKSRYKDDKEYTFGKDTWVLKIKKFLHTLMMNWIN